MPCGFKPYVPVLINLYDPGGVVLRRRIFLCFCNTNIINHHQDENPARCYARRPKHQVNRWLYTQAVIKLEFTEFDFEPELMAFQMVQWFYLWSL